MKRKLVGVVTSDKMNKSLRVEIERRFAHPMYGKIVRGRTVCHVHDEENVAHTGDTVEIIECRPRSKTKRWDLVRVVKSPVLAGAELKPQDDNLDTATEEATDSASE
ncbi:MAG: 30S ribosomal protein S17 [Planctomycetaceae bacterium]|jgi:small subunit ribosomal protein S17|nr:30S ribosomal protein S17 [Planctomycetaceae bacterium]MBT6153954.1 30S ribosomal protein S17 [Planctomycetaceae bacterium]MBT6483744.1 30S ribosomal protein S17 [Planctomycetaceae bacterium]MBT6497010.1 30S ribosomal protein S17 [Planctomycetaceae bacterium]